MAKAKHKKAKGHAHDGHDAHGHGDHGHGDHDHDAHDAHHDEPPPPPEPETPFWFTALGGVLFAVFGIAFLVFTSDDADGDKADKRPSARPAAVMPVPVPGGGAARPGNPNEGRARPGRGAAPGPGGAAPDDAARRPLPIRRLQPGDIEKAMQKGHLATNRGGLAGVARKLRRNLAPTRENLVRLTPCGLFVPRSSSLRSPSLHPSPSSPRVAVVPIPMVSTRALVSADSAARARAAVDLQARRARAARTAASAATANAPLGRALRRARSTVRRSARTASASPGKTRRCVRPTVLRRRSAAMDVVRMERPRRPAPKTVSAPAPRV
jgi:hypothetical protein